MAALEFNAEYDRIKGGDGRRYTVWKGTGPGKHSTHANGALLPENYAPRPGYSSRKWPCPVIGCIRAFRLLKELGNHFTPEHKGANLHDLRNGQFRPLSYAGNGPPRVVFRSNKPPTPILPPVPPSSPASSVVRSSSVERGPTPGIYIKSEHPIMYEDGQQAELIVLDSEDDEHTSSIQDVGEVAEEEEEEDSNEDMDDIFSNGAGPDKESVTSVSDAGEDDVAVQTPDRNGPANENLENGQFFNYAASPVWRYINRFTPSPIPVPEDTCLREFLTLPLARKLPHCWHVLLAQHRFATEYFNLKMMTGVAMFLTGEEMDVAACTTSDRCLFRNSVQVAQALSDFAAKGDVVHNIFAFPRCVVPSADFLERSATLKERLGGITCCNAYYHLGKVPEPKLVYVAGYPLPYPTTPENPPRAAPAPARKDNVASPTSGQLQQSSSYNGLPQFSPLKSRSTFDSLKRKIPPCAESDDYLHSYRLSADPVTPAKWESVNGVLRQQDSHLAPVFAYSPSYVSHHSSSDYSHKQANKRIMLLSSPSSDGSRGSTIADFRIIHLHRLHNTNGTSNADYLKPKTVQSVSLPVSESHAFVCSVASGGPVRVYLDKGKGEGQERPFDIMDGGVWIVEKGWDCRMEVAVGAAGHDGDVATKDAMQVTASVHVTGVLASETGKETDNKNKQERKQEREQERKEKREQKKKEKETKKAIKVQQKTAKEQAKKIIEERKRENLARRQAKQAKQEKRRLRVVKREKKQVKNVKKEKKEKKREKQE